MNSMPGLSIEFSDNNNYICRHIATDKNELNIHGRSSKTKRGRWAETQLTQLETFCKEKGIRSIQYGDTPQCSITADLICRRTGLQRSLLNLQPFDLGEFAGLSHLDLLTKNRHLGLALERFRYRVSSYADSGLANFSDPADLTLQIRSWLEELQRTGPSDTLFVLSNSLIVKTVNALHGIFPDQPNYLNVGVANGSVLDLPNWHYELEQWPNSKSHRILTSFGDLVIREYLPKASFTANARVIIYPGLFGSSRFGPYNLFNRMARHLAGLGIAVSVVDPIGSGESLPMFRDVLSEKQSIRAVQDYYSNREQTIFVAHSLSANLVQRFDDPNIMGKVLIAPILDTEWRREQWAGHDGVISRHGLKFDANVWAAEQVGLMRKDETSFAFFGSDDSYVDCSLASKFFEPDRTYILDGAGHNFSEGDAANDLTLRVCNVVQEILFL